LLVEYQRNRIADRQCLPSMKIAKISEFFDIKMQSRRGRRQ
jgi:hypothetical protein